MLMALLARHKVKLHDAGLCSDDPERLAIVLRAEAERSDLIITSGAAAGSETDHLAKAVRLAGGTAEHHHIVLNRENRCWQVPSETLTTSGFREIRLQQWSPRCSSAAR